MVTLRDGRLVPLEPLAKLVRADQSAFQQEVEGAVHGGHPHPLALTLELAANALYGEVIL